MLKKHRSLPAPVLFSCAADGFIVQWEKETSGGGRAVEKTDWLWPGGVRYVYDEAAFRPGTDTFLLGAFPKLWRGARVCDLGAGIGLLGLLLLAREQQQAQQPDPRAEVAHARPAPQLRERAEQERVRPWAEGRLVIDIPHPARPEPVRFLHRAPSSARFFLPLYDKTVRGARKKHRSGQAPVLFQHAM